MSRGPLALVVLLAGCGPRVDVGWTLPDGGVILVREERQTTTRTPLGLEEARLTIGQVWRVLQPGTLGVDDVAWREDTTSWSVTYTDRGGPFTWTLGEGQALPEALRALGPLQPREVYVSREGEVRVVQLRPPAEPEPEPPPEPRRRRAEPERAPVPWTSTDRVPSWVVGFVNGPQEPQRPRASWSWSATREVSERTTARTTTEWTLQAVNGDTAMLRESTTLTGSPPPSEGSFQTTRLSGGADLRFDVTTRSLLSYAARYEADIASPSSRGTATRVSEVRLEVR